MPDQPITIAEEISASLTRQLVRRGVLDMSDVEAMSEGLSSEAEAVMRAVFLEAQVAPASEVRAIKAREGFRVVGEEE